VVVKYHNITPPHFYLPYDLDATIACERGVTQTHWLASHHGRIERFVADSSFNAEELVALGVPAAKVLVAEPFAPLEEYARAQVVPAVAERIAAAGDDVVNVLFVGRCAPNKGHKHLLRTLDALIEATGGRARLHLVGALSPSLQRYYDELTAFVARRRLGAFVAVHGSVDGDVLRTYFDACDVFLCQSEHEGFCVPILEAQVHGLPVIALARAAVPATLGPGQLVHDEPDPEWFAAACARVCGDATLRAMLTVRGRENAARYETPVLAQRFMAALGGLLAGAR
jgi:glycosyltransferase involved in cell wall biosynthesis